jgi:geranylgeranyl pyrophosphate synthase
LDIFKQYNTLIERINQCLIDSISPESPQNLREPIQYFFDQPSKKIRPLLSIFCCEAVGGNKEDAIPAATAIELFHDFTLIHDDIMDQDEMRRGKLTIHMKWDSGTAILVGDALIGLSFQQLLKSPPKYLDQVVKIFSEALVKVCEGQALDKSFETAPYVNLENYLDMIAKKTAWLFKVSCEIGAILGDGDSKQVEQLSQFGYNLGLAFQIQDDLLDFVADETKLGKKIGSDFKMDKKTYITLKYQEMLENKPELKKQYPIQEKDYKSLAKFQKVLKEIGLVKEVENEVNQYFKESLNWLQKILIDGTDHPLYRITHLIEERQY